jgi:hypothetical protein
METGIIDHFNTTLVTTLNYNDIAGSTLHKSPQYTLSNFGLLCLHQSPDNDFSQCRFFSFNPHFIVLWLSAALAIPFITTDLPL